MTILYGIYGVVLLVGGVMGYVKAKSVPSLVAGIMSAVIMGVAIALLSTYLRTGLGIGVVVSFALVFVFGPLIFVRKTHIAMPSLLIMTLSAVVLLTSMFALFPPPHA